MISTKITNEEKEFSLFDKRWSELKHDFFKLETRQFYANEYSPGFKDFQDGKINLAGLRGVLRKFLTEGHDSQYEKIRQGEIKYRRLHVVDLPLSPYLNYEIESYRISVEFGEQVFIITRSEVEKLPIPAELHDLLIFDDRYAHLQFYDENTGLWKYTEVFEDPKQLADFVEEKNLLLENAHPLEEFLAKSRP